MAMIGKVLRMRHREKKSVREIQGDELGEEYGAQVPAHRQGGGAEVQAT